MLQNVSIYWCSQPSTLEITHLSSHFYCPHSGSVNCLEHHIFVYCSVESIEGLQGKRLTAVVDFTILLCGKHDLRSI